MIELTRQGPVAIARMDSPPVNALDVDMLDALSEMLDEVKASDATALIMTGREGVFSAGADLKRVLESDADYRARGIAALGRAFMGVFTFERPVIAAVNGHAIAGGAVLACCADRRIAARTDARIGLAELAVGVPFPLPALEIVRFTVRHVSLQSLVYFAELHGPDDAASHGLIDEVVEPDALMDRAIEVAERLASIPAATFGHTKRALRQPVLDHLVNHTSTFDSEASYIWGADETLASIRTFMDSLSPRP